MVIIKYKKIITPFKKSNYKQYKNKNLMINQIVIKRRGINQHKINQIKIILFNHTNNQDKLILIVAFKVAFA